MSDLYICAHCKTHLNRAGSGSETEDGQFHTLRPDMISAGWQDIVAKGEGIYVHAQFCSERCMKTWAIAMAGGSPRLDA